MAEGEGFEPSVQALIPYSGLANRRFRPLSHPSAAIVAQTYQTPPKLAIRLSRSTMMSSLTVSTYLSLALSCHPPPSAL